MLLSLFPSVHEAPNSSVTTNERTFRRIHLSSLSPMDVVTLTRGQRGRPNLKTVTQVDGVQESQTEMSPLEILCRDNVTLALAGSCRLPSAVGGQILENGTELGTGDSFHFSVWTAGNKEARPGASARGLLTSMQRLSPPWFPPLPLRTQLMQPRDSASSAANSASDGCLSLGDAALIIQVPRETLIFYDPPPQIRVASSASKRRKVHMKWTCTEEKGLHQIEVEETESDEEPEAPPDSGYISFSNKQKTSGAPPPPPIQWSTPPTGSPPMTWSQAANYIQARASVAATAFGTPPQPPPPPPPPPKPWNY